MVNLGKQVSRSSLIKFCDGGGDSPAHSHGDSPGVSLNCGSVQNHPETCGVSDRGSKGVKVRIYD